MEKVSIFQLKVKENFKENGDVGNCKKVEFRHKTIYIKDV